MYLCGEGLRAVCVWVAHQTRIIRQIGGGWESKKEKKDRESETERGRERGREIKRERVVRDRELAS